MVQQNIFCNATSLCHESSALRHREPFATPTCIRGAQSGGRTRSVRRTAAFEAAASANFAIWAYTKLINPASPPGHPLLMVFIGCLLDWITRIRRRAIVWIAWATVVAASFARVVYILVSMFVPAFTKTVGLAFHTPTDSVHIVGS